MVVDASKKKAKEKPGISTWGSSIRRPYNAFNNHIYLPGSRSCNKKEREKEKKSKIII